MSQSHIFLTGGTGFFGKALLRQWAVLYKKGQTNVRVTLLSRNPGQFAKQYPSLVEHHWLNLVGGDVCDPNSLPQGGFTHVLHAATDSTTGPQLTPLQRTDQIVTGTRNILNLAVASGAKRFLLTSSGGVYGPQPAELERIPEDYLGMPDPLNPNNAYGVAKRYAEHLCALYKEEHGLGTVIARCFAFVGRDLPLDVHFAIGNFIRDALKSPEIIVNGDGTQVRSYMDQRDLSTWLLYMLENARPGSVYNIGSDQAITLEDLALQVRDILAPKKTVRILGKVIANGARSRYVPDISRARVDLGLDMEFSLSSSIRATAEALG